MKHRDYEIETKYTDNSSQPEVFGFVAKSGWSWKLDGWDQFDGLHDSEASAIDAAKAHIDSLLRHPLKGDMTRAEAEEWRAGVSND